MFSFVTNILAQSSQYNINDSYYNSVSDPAVNGAVAAGFIAFMTIYLVFLLAVTIFMTICMWKIFTKANKPGWASIIPIYNQIVLLEIVNKPIWWIVLLFIPFVNIIVLILLDIELARAYGKSDLFAALLIFIPIVGYPILAFDKNIQYKGTVNASSATPQSSAAPSSNIAETVPSQPVEVNDTGSTETETESRSSDSSPEAPTNDDVTTPK